MITKQQTKDVLTVLRELNLTVYNSKGCELLLTNCNIDLITDKVNYQGDESEEDIQLNSHTLNVVYH